MLTNNSLACYKNMCQKIKKVQSFYDWLLFRIWRPSRFTSQLVFNKRSRIVLLVSQRFMGRASASSLCGLFVATTAVWCARRAAVTSSWLINPPCTCMQLRNPFIVSTNSRLAAMIKCFTALLALPFFNSIVARLCLEKACLKMVASSKLLISFFSCSDT